MYELLCVPPGDSYMTTNRLIIEQKQSPLNKINNFQLSDMI